MTGRASRTRGANAERAVAAYMRDNGWPNARRCLAGDGNQHTDIDGIPGVSIEVKDRASSSWPAWRLQATRQAHEGDVLVVVRRFRGMTDPGRWEAHIPLRDWHWIGGGKPRDIDTVICPRTEERWVRTTLADIVHHLNQDTPT